MNHQHSGPTISRRAFSTGALALAGTAGATGLAGPAAAEPKKDPAAPFFEQLTLWDAEVDPLENYHVHGLVVLPDDTVLTATEGRYEVCDAGPRDILVRRSTDGGRTFEPTQIVIPSVDGQSWGNPTFLVDRDTGTVFLFYMLSIKLPENTSCSGDIGDLYVVHSTDGGSTWSEPRNISGLFEHFPYDWALHGPGPGHGIQLADGRLLLNVSHRRVIIGNTVDQRFYGVSTLYSDDHGETWIAGGEIPVSVDYPLGEARMVERLDGSVLINARASAGGNRQRIISVSTDGGVTWADPLLDGATGVFNAVDAGMITYSGGPGRSEPSRVLFSRPDAPVRRNLTVSVSYDEGISLWFSRVITTERAYYSDLARLSDGTIILLYGCDGDIPSAPLRVRLARFNLAWLTDGRDHGGKTRLWSERVINFADLDPIAGSVTPQVITDPLARGGSRIELAETAPGDQLEYGFTAPTGSYQLQLRYFRPEAGAAFEILIDGQPLPAATAFDAQSELAPGYEPVHLGTVRLSGGRHRVRIVATGPGRTGGTGLGLDSLSLVSAPEPDVRNEVLVDNNQLGWEVVSGTWRTSTTGVQGAYSANYRHHPAGDGRAVVRWTPVVPVDGEYEIQCSLLAFPNRASNAPFAITRGDRTDVVRIDQRIDGEWDVRGTRWRSLGRFRLTRGLTTSIALSNDADNTVAADAVRLIRVG